MLQHITKEVALTAALDGGFERSPEADAFWILWLEMEGFIIRVPDGLAVTNEGIKAIGARANLRLGRKTDWLHL